MFPTSYFPRRYFPGRYFTPDTETEIEEGWIEVDIGSDTWTIITPPGEE